MLASFLGSLLTAAIRLPGGARYCQVRLAPWILPAVPLSTPFNLLFRQQAGVSLLRRHVASYVGNGILTVCPSNTPFGFSLGPDLP